MSGTESDPRQSWLEERRSAYIYAELAKIEKGTPRETLFQKLGEFALGQSEVWKKKIHAKEGSGAVLTFTPGLRTEVVLKITRKLGPRRMKTALAALKVRGLSAYSTTTNLASGHPVPANVDEVGQRHHLKGSGNNLRAAVFGINDGLVSNAGMILGVAAASASDPRIIVLSGTSALFAGALSMASGEYISVKSQRELLEYQLDLERAELAEYPEEEAAELALIYRSRGIPEADARDLANRMIADPERALATLAREELGLDPNDLASPWGAAISSFLAFACGGAVPLIPFLISRSPATLNISLGVTGLALFATGVAVSFFSGRSMVWSGLRMLLIGGGAGLVSYLIGKGVA